METQLLSLKEKEEDLQPRNNNRRPLRACKHGFIPFYRLFSFYLRCVTIPEKE